MADSNTRSPSGFVVFLGSAGVLAFVVILFAFTIGRTPKIENVDKIRGDQRSATRQKLENDANTLLATAGEIDKAKGIYRVPIADAMKLVAVELAAKKPAPSQVKVEPPLPMPAPYDPKSTEPPAPIFPSSPQGSDTIRFDTPAPVPSASIVPPAGGAVASVAPSRPPLINWTESSETKK